MHFSSLGLVVRCVRSLVTDHDSSVNARRARVARFAPREPEAMELRLLAGATLPWAMGPAWAGNRAVGVTGAAHVQVFRGASDVATHNQRDARPTGRRVDRLPAPPFSRLSA
jgi:hypothetical protein